jgi:GNAT superfamily N-acetyltransferase
VGRIAGLVHAPYNLQHGEATLRFHQLDAVNDPAVVQALLGGVERWGLARGMRRVLGPFGLSDKDPQGLQVEGFEHLPVVATPTNPAHLPPLVEACGYVKHIDLVSYRLAVPHQVPERYARVAAHALQRDHLHVLPLRSKRDLRPWIIPVLELVNRTYNDIFGFVPMTADEMHKLAGDYLPLLDPGLVVVIADRTNAPVAFVVALPDLSEGLQRCGGRLLPFGFLQVFAAMRRARQLDLLLGAVRRDLQGRGLTAALGVQLLATARARGFTTIDSHLVLETNRAMRAQLDRLGGEVYKRFRIYAKDLVPPGAADGGRADR